MPEFSLGEARAVLAAIRTFAPNGLDAPFSAADFRTIADAGAEVKNVELGLLDFPTTILDAPAYWCWQAGEDEIAWWHLQATGFAGRQRVIDLPEEYLR